MVVAVGVAALIAIPAVVGALPVSVSAPPPAILLQRVVASAALPYQGYVLSEANLALPNVSEAQGATELLNNTTRLRAWVNGPDRWRVDDLSTVSETDTYLDQGGAWMWDSGRNRATRVVGEPGARLARPDDLLPPELGRLLADAATPDEVGAMGPKRVAGVAAAGLRIIPHAGETTISSVDLWVNPGTGLPLEVAVYAPGSRRPVLQTRFLDLSQSRAPAPLVTFQPPAGPVRTVDWDDVDIAARIDERSPVLLPDVLGSLTRRTADPAPVATYGTGFSVVAVVALPGRLRFDLDQQLDKLPSVDTPVGPGRLVESPLLNGLVISRGAVLYAIVGAVHPAQLTALAPSLPPLGRQLS